MFRPSPEGSELSSEAFLRRESVSTWPPQVLKPEILASFLCFYLFGDIQPEHHTENLNPPNPTGELLVGPELLAGGDGVFLGVFLPDSHGPDQITSSPAPLVKIVLCKGFAHGKSSGLLPGCFCVLLCLHYIC